MPDIIATAAKFPDLLKEIYGDLAKPGVTQAGIALGGLVGLGNTAMLPIHLLNEKARLCLERNLENYRSQVEKIPENEVAEVPAELGVPILDKLSYVSNAELSDMYVNLLAKASKQGTANSAHPGFTQMIERLSPDEGVLLKKLQGKQAIPFIEIRLSSAKTNEWQTLADMVFHPEYLSDLTFPQNISSYFSNLDSLGIVTNRWDIWITPTDQHYNPIWAVYESQYKIFDRGIPDKKLDFQKCRSNITPFGSLFLSACFTKLN